MLKSFTESSPDDMILLRHAGRRRETPPVALLEVVYWKIEDIQHCLLSGPEPEILSGDHFTAGRHLERLWNYCYWHAEPETTKWLSARHRFYFLGPLAYVLLYLAAAEDHIRSALEVQPFDDALRFGLLWLRSPIGVLTRFIQPQGFTYDGDSSARGHNA